MKTFIKLWLSFFVVASLTKDHPSFVKAEPLKTFLEKNPDLTSFFQIFNQSPYMKATLTWKQGILLVPTNEAIFNYRNQDRKKFDNLTLMYHFSNSLLRLGDLELLTSIHTELPAYSPIWITKTDHGTYLNNAGYKTGNFEVEVEGSRQLVHVIDRVLEPTIPQSNFAESSFLHNPDAGKYLDHGSTYTNSDDQLLTLYSRQVSKANRRALFSDSKTHTYFIPVDSALKNVIDKIDAAVIEGHIIPGRTVFLRPAQLNFDYDTYRAPGDNTSNITISFEKRKRKEDGREMWLVKSDNHRGDKTHRKGVVQAEIIKGNIPVKNGVVHLVSKALVVIDSDVYKTLEWYADRDVGSMKRFFDMINDLGRRGYHTEIRNLLESHGSGKGITLFVPSNSAIETSSDLQIRRTNASALMEILRTHILREPISTDEMINGSRNKRFPFQVSSMENGRKILFSSVETSAGGSRTVHLEGGGVNATILQADFGATNGFIHIIDHVLGIPDQTVNDKLKSHPMLQTTYMLWNKLNFHPRFNNTHYPITFFAPSELAWENIRRVSSAAFHNLLAGTDLMNVLERHIILERELSIADLQKISLRSRNVTKPDNKTADVDFGYAVKALRGYLKVNQSREWITKMQHSHPHHPTPPTQKPKTNELYYYVYYNRVWAHVIRPNVKCTDGYIHIIDDVLMEMDEILVAGANQLQNKMIFSLFFPLAGYGILKIFGFGI